MRHLVEVCDARIKLLKLLGKHLLLGEQLRLVGLCTRNKGVRVND